ncbi:AMP-binding protein [Gordonia amarae]|uniref:Long-chain fatty-acid--CoA ligase n=2 Tax=Gordonia amarae TaxID=36821 RepID=G7GKF6_9ACTN|nr:AMP-binding protein [Gordonia amarae]QHN18959.1 AMP-binding protein [Gordonia amarae]QHN23434.1 AMP-binding protein [Gordonia amarae]QHN32335.1 AMP-binding protein [Gordonia amarae]QHN41083.1 AMP-binding protein [Gordonia amarae]GAB04081.1 long-chain fatty-acid--CoA ligase [Gordonia amarae NBRC 15530]
MTVAELLLALADVDDRGLYFEDDFISWRDHVTLSRQRGTMLAPLLDPDRPPHVGVLLENVPEFSYLFGAAALGGFVLVGLNTTRRGDALAADVTRSDCQLVLVSDATAHLYPADSAVRVINIDGPEWSGLVSDGRVSARPRDRSPAPDDLLMLIFTSGTTGDPKAVRCNQRKFADPGKMLAERFSIGAGDVAYIAMPMFHSNALIAGWSIAVAGSASIALRRRFSARGFADDVHRYGITFANYVGTPMRYILATEPRPDDASSPLRIMYGNEASAADRTAFAKRFGCRVVDGFGSTESGVAITRTPDTPDDALGPLREPNAVVDPDTGAPVPPGTVGEIVNSSGPGLFSGYYNDKEATDDRLRGGMYHTGDLGWVDDAGYIHFAGRVGDWMRVDGENLGAQPIERILLRHDQIRFAAVFGVPVEIGDEIVAALVADNLTPEALSGFLATQPDLGPKQWPHRIVLLDTLPETATFKTVKRHLRPQADTPTWTRQDRRYVPAQDTRTSPGFEARR